MDAAGLAFGIVPLAVKLIQYLKNVKDAPDDRQALITQFNLYIEYAKLVEDRKSHNQISDRAEQSLEQHCTVLERLNAILQEPKLQKLLQQPAIVETGSSTIVGGQTSITISDASSFISTESSTTGNLATDIVPSAGTDSSISDTGGVTRRRKRDLIKKWFPFRTLKTGGNKVSQSYLFSATTLHLRQQEIALDNASSCNSAARKSSTIKTLVDPWVWPFQQDEFKELLQSLETTTSILHKMLQLEHINVAEETRLLAEGIRTVAEETRAAAVEIHSKLEGDTRQKAYEWLSPLTFWSAQDKVYANLQPGTGTWFLENEKFTKWLRGDFNALFCYGMPGAGKTTLMSLVIQHLRDNYYLHEEISENKPVGLAFLFCSYHERQTQTLSNLLGSILRQLEKCCYITPDLSELYAEYWEREKRNLSLDGMIERINKCASALGKVFLVVDALDELESTHKRKLVRKHLFNLIQSHRNVQLLATSRPDSEIDEFFTNKDYLSLEIRAQDSDIKLYVDERIKELSETGENLHQLVHNDPELQEEVVERISEQASGMFLIAQLHITSIANMPNYGKLKEALSKLPKDLDDTYCNAITRIQMHHKESWEIIQKALLLVTFTLHQLEPDALLDAIATYEDAGFNKDYRTNKAYLLSNCGGLLIEEEYRDDPQNKAVVRNKTVIRFIHHSAREFFEKNPHLLFPSTYYSVSPTELIAEAHSIITLACLAYLMTDRHEAYQNAQWDGENLRTNFPFMWYSFCFWGLHASIASKDRIQNKLYQHFDHEHSTGYSNGLRCYRVFDTFWEFESYPSVRDWTLDRRIHAASGSGSVFVAAVVFDLGVLVKGYILQNPSFIPSLPGSFLRTCLTATAWNGNMDLFRQLWIRAADIDLNSSDNAIGSCIRAITPLWAAAYNGHDKVVELLLSNDRVDINIANKIDATALYAAAQNGHDKVVKLLQMDDRMDINMATKNGGTPLNVAAQEGHRKVVELLLENDRVNVNLSTKDGWTPLHNTARKGHSKVVELLLANARVDVNMATKDGRTPMCIAAEEGHDRVVGLLLANDRVNVNMADIDGWTPLYVAAQEGHSKVVQLLLANNRVDVNIASNDNWTALHIATLKGHHEVVKLLLANDKVDVNITNNDTWTPLHIAAFKGYDKIVELLLVNDKVSTNMGTQHGTTPLYIAAQHGHDKVVKLMLLANDRVYVNPTENLYGMTPLYAAAVKGHDKVVELFVMNDRVDVNMVEKSYGMTPLYAAAHKGRHKVVEVLLANDRIGVNIANKNGWTPLFAAAAKGHDNIVELLLAVNGIDINRGNTKGDTPLHIAAHNGHARITELLLAHDKIDITKANAASKTALANAMERGHGEIVTLLHSKLQNAKKCSRP